MTPRRRARDLARRAYSHDGWIAPRGVLAEMIEEEILAALEPYRTLLIHLRDFVADEIQPTEGDHAHDLMTQATDLIHGPGEQEERG